MPNALRASRDNARLNDVERRVRWRPMRCRRRRSMSCSPTSWPIRCGCWPRCLQHARGRTEHIVLAGILQLQARSGQTGVCAMVRSDWLRSARRLDLPVWRAACVNSYFQRRRSRHRRESHSLGWRNPIEPVDEHVYPLSDLPDPFPRLAGAASGFQRSGALRPLPSRVRRICYAVRATACRGTHAMDCVRTRGASRRFIRRNVRRRCCVAQQRPPGEPPAKRSVRNVSACRRQARKRTMKC